MKQEQINVTGKVVSLGEVEIISDKFSKKIVAIETKEDYPQTIGIDFVNDKIKLAENLSLGDEITISVNIRGREWKGKYFISLNGWRVEVGSGEKSTPAPKEQEKDLPF